MEGGMEVTINPDNIRFFNIKTKHEELPIMQEETDYDSDSFGIILNIEPPKQYATTHILELLLKDGNWYSALEYDDYNEALKFAKDTFINAKHVLSIYEESVLKRVKQYGEKNINLDSLKTILKNESGRDFEYFLLTLINLDDWDYTKIDALSIWEKYQEEDEKEFEILRKKSRKVRSNNSNYTEDAKIKIDNMLHVRLIDKLERGGVKIKRKFTGKNLLTDYPELMAEIFVDSDKGIINLSANKYIETIYTITENGNKRIIAQDEELDDDSEYTIYCGKEIDEKFNIEGIAESVQVKSDGLIIWFTQDRLYSLDSEIIVSDFIKELQGFLEFCNKFTNDPNLELS